MSSENWQNSLKTIRERNKYLLETHVLSDIVFRFKQENCDDFENIYAHKFELAKRSSVFEKIFKDGSIKEWNITDFSKKSFYEMIKFLYLDEIEVNVQNSVDILKLSKTYNINALEETYSNFITKNLAVDNVCTLLKISLEQDIDSLKQTCVKFIEENTKMVLEHTSLLDADKQTMHIILDVNQHCSVGPLEFFDAAVKWAKHQCGISELNLTSKNIREVLGDLIYLICFPNMVNDDFIKSLEEYQLLTVEEIGQIFLYFNFKIMGDGDIKFKIQKQNKIDDESLKIIKIEEESADIYENINSTFKFSVSKYVFLHGLESVHPGSIALMMFDESKLLHSFTMENGTLKLSNPIILRPNVTYEIKSISYPSNGVEYLLYGVKVKECTVDDITLYIKEHADSIINKFSFTSC